MKGTGKLLKGRTNFLVLKSTSTMYSMSQKIQWLVVSLLGNPLYISFWKQKHHPSETYSVWRVLWVAVMLFFFFFIHGATRNVCKCPWNVLNNKIFIQCPNHDIIKLFRKLLYSTIGNGITFRKWIWLENRLGWRVHVFISLKNTMFNFSDVLIIHFHFWWWCFLTIYQEMS